MVGTQKLLESSLKQLRHSISNMTPGSEKQQRATEYAEALEAWEKYNAHVKRVSDFAQRWLWTLVVPIAIIVYLLAHASKKQDQLFAAVQEKQKAYYDVA